MSLLGSKQVSKSEVDQLRRLLEQPSLVRRKRKEKQ